MARSSLLFPASSTHLQVVYMIEEPAEDDKQKDKKKDKKGAASAGGGSAESGNGTTGRVAGGRSARLQAKSADINTDEEARVRACTP